MLHPAVEFLQWCSAKTKYRTKLKQNIIIVISLHVHLNIA